MHSDLFGSAPAREAVVHNVFFALVPDTETRAHLASTVARLKTEHDGRGRWLAPERWHMTLYFLGSYSELPQERIESARAAARNVAAAAFELALDRVGHFSHGIGWLGCAQTGTPLQSLWSELHRSLAHARVATQGHAGFVPHVTVVREAKPLLPAQSIPPIAWPVREFVLIDSVLGPRSEYRELGRWKLR
ncbi:RNA 2',3'-cyclic phosphodiesterase [Lysobacter solisilvae (ex Woo and Kim 2020)]|uniref:RNA 2',3'-cyclic phosphodiesterase n=1 Tax=Agrilutibacter terrestris TaxID=2865112 RepID=A0A7H0FX41_9GAMM|nr:RNA 2',3'-cyclic phosphodiesterase [Lysobacter terrestris]QNP40607.1 RNA 2',3'-cyclic phosphodiesterase [Lysobacter terrestris]